MAKKAEQQSEVPPARDYFDVVEGEDGEAIAACRFPGCRWTRESEWGEVVPGGAARVEYGEHVAAEHPGLLA
jgi:hypothetical protein